MDLNSIIMDSKLINMAVSTLQTNLGFINDSNFTIILGVFVTITVMGTSILYDEYQRKNKKLHNKTELKSSSVSDQKTNNHDSRHLNSSSEFNEKLNSLIPKKVNKSNSETSEIKFQNSKDGIKKVFGSLRSKFPSFSLSSHGKETKSNDGKSILHPDNKTQAKFNGIDKFSNFDVDKIVESKKSEFDFDDDLLSEMSTAESIKENTSSIKENKSTPFNGDLSFDTDEFDLGFENINDESSEDDLLFSTSSQKLDLNDEHDSLLASLKNDIVIKNEKKIDFMTAMQGENLDLKLIKSELQDVLKKLNKYRQYSHNN